MSVPPDPQRPAGLIQLPPGKQKPWLAFLVSYLLVGGGQFYNRQFLKGAVFLLGVVVFVGATFYHAEQTHPGMLILPTAPSHYFVVLLFVLSVDADLVAVRLHHGDAVHPWEWF